ncbi:response regulator [Candidatus Viridilinea mediisalina]|nr:response regulator [Candidatus Viridilinea mediisalina]
MARTRIFLIDPNSALVEATCALFAESDYVQIVGAAADLNQALDRIALLRPDFVLIDFIQADQTTFGLIRNLKAQPAAPHVIVMSIYDSPRYEQAARVAGADGFISKVELVHCLEPLVASFAPVPLPRSKRHTGSLHAFSSCA